MSPIHSTLGHLILLLVILAAVGLFIQRTWRLVRLVRLGAYEDRFDDIPGRIRDFGLYVIGQRKLIKSPNRIPGIIHALIFWGFLIITLGTVQLLGSGLIDGFLLPAVGNDPLYMALLDLMIVVVLASVGAAAYRRIVLKPYRLTTKPDAWIILGLISTLMVTLLLAEAFGIVAHPTTLAKWSFIGNALSGIVGGTDHSLADTLFGLLWWLHVLTVLGFLVYLPSSKHLHILSAPFTVFFRPSTPKGAMTPIRNIEEQEHFGVGKLEQFGWKHLLDTFSCTECGRCDRNCPALLSGKPLSPKEVVLQIKYGLFEEADALLAGKTDSPSGHIPLLGGRIADETLWSCTTCRWCVEACPVFIEHVPKILDMRRNLVLEESRFPEEIIPVFASLEKNGNPLQQPKKQRAAWAKDLDVPLLADLAEGEQIEVLYFVGCMGSYDQRNKKVAAAIVTLLKAANVKFAILGKEEVCTGDPARRIGNEYLYQTLAQQNIETLNGYGVKKVLTACAHCFNTIKNEYPQFGGDYQVVHHTEFIAELIAAGRLTLDKPVQDGTMTFHDPCYLGRYNDVYEPQRQVLQSLPMAKMVEMERSHKTSFCCGGGGGRSFMEEKTGKRISHIRIEQAMAVKPDTIVAACPFCTTMFEDGIKGRGVEDQIKVRDFAEIVAAALAETSPAPTPSLIESTSHPAPFPD